MGMVEDLITSGPTKTSGTTSGKPIGVPSDYVAPVPVTIQRDPIHADPWEIGSAGQPTTVMAGQPPRYMQGDEWLPATLSVEDRVALQRAMAGAGLLKGEYRNGIWDDKSRSAYANLLEFANASGLTWQQALNQWAGATRIGGRGGGGGGRARAPLTVKVSSPEDLAEIFNQTARTVLGRRLTPEESQRFVNAYQGVEKQVQQQAYRTAPAGGQITEPPSPDVFAEKRIREQSPGEASAHDLAMQFDNFLRIIRTIGS
jgi:hypothetical protein